MKTMLEISVDTNDGDYFVSSHEIKNEQTILKLREILKKIKDNNVKHLRWEGYSHSETKLLYPFLTEDEIEFVSSCCRVHYSEEEFHTIEYIKIYKKIDEEILFI